MHFPSDQRITLECDYHDVMHRIVMEYDDDLPADGVTVYVSLAPCAGFFKRLWNAVRYLFRCDTSTTLFYTDTVLSTNETAKAQAFLQQYAEDHDGFWTSKEQNNVPYVPKRGYSTD